MTDNEQGQERISRELAALDVQRTRWIEELLSGVDLTRESQLIANLDLYHALTVAKLTRLGDLQRAW